MVLRFVNAVGYSDAHDTYNEWCVAVKILSLRFRASLF